MSFTFMIAAIAWTSISYLTDAGRDYSVALSCVVLSILLQQIPEWEFRSIRSSLPDGAKASSTNIFVGLQLAVAALALFPVVGQILNLHYERKHREIVLAGREVA
ncbi:hypothetical protein HK101_002363 [Irineochytrium annulatum]|nr:hypothetical protein HK101_002363 [Irineochytrium annulatum]